MRIPPHPYQPVYFNLRRTRGSSSFLDLPSTGLLLDLDPARDVYTDSGMTTPAGNTDSVAAIGDQSASNYDFNESGGTKPIYSTTVAAANNRPGLVFAGAGVLGRTMAGIVAGLSAYTFFAVWLSTSTTGTTTIYGEHNTGNTTPLVLLRYRNSSTTMRYFHRSDASVLPTLTATATHDDGTPHLTTVRRITATSWSHRHDEVELATDTDNVGATTVNQVTIGGRGLTSPAELWTGTFLRLALYSNDPYVTVEPLLRDWYGV